MERFFISLAMALVTVLANAQSCPDDNHPHAIDLGLPSGTKWACCNVGATSPEGHGNYYAWGETEVKEIYDWTTYTHCDGSKETCHDLGSDIAGTEHDVAHVKWGGSWEMPSQGQIRELTEQCSYKWTARNGVGGVLFTGPSGGTIFLPESGFWRKGSGSSAAIDYNGNDEDGEADEIPSSGLYWASTPRISNTSHASSSLFFSNGYVYWDTYYNRSFGLTVRPVMSGANSFIDGYRPMLSDGKVWKTVFIHGESPEDSTFTYVNYMLSGKEAVDGIECYKLYKSSASTVKWGTEDYSFYAYLREDGQKVYILRDGEWDLMFDFGLQVGDFFKDKYEVWSISQVSLGIQHAPFTLIQLRAGGGSWVPGIGDLTLGPVNEPGMTIPSGSFRESLCYYVEEKEGVLYDQSYAVDISIITYGIANVSAEGVNRSSTIYDLQGRRLAAKPVKGMYIQGGRKYVAR